MREEYPKLQPIQYLWGLLCTLSSIDQERNNISLFNVVEQFNLPKSFFDKKTDILPYKHEIITTWRRTIDTAIDDRSLSIDVEFALVDPNGKDIEKIITPLRLDSNQRRLRFRLVKDGIHITDPGDYYYRVSISSPDGKISQVGTIPLQVKIKEG